MASCVCPPPASIGTIPVDDCPVRIGQIQRVIFQRSGFVFDGTAGKDITLEADWDTLYAAVDSTKVVITPFFGGNPVIEAGEAITVGGGDNSTLNGITRVTGANPSSFSTEFYNMKSDVENALKALECEKNLVAYFITEDGKIAVREIAASEYTGYGVQTLFTSDRGVQGYAADDILSLTFQLVRNWSSELELITPAFDILNWKL